VGFLVGLKARFMDILGWAWVWRLWKGVHCFSGWEWMSRVLFQKEVAGERYG
jgi:hypothetical protein